MSSLIQLDRLDAKILTALTADGRISWRELADQIGLSLTPTLRRVHNLESAGIIRGYSATLDETLLAGSMSVFVSITLERQVEGSLTAFEAEAYKIPHVMSCFLMTGGSDYLLRVLVQDLAEYSLVVDKLTKIPGVAHIQSSFALRPVIQRQTPPINIHTGRRSKR